MAEKAITCIACPIGCDVTARGDNGEIVFMEGNKCKRGEEYVKNEFFNPVRILATTVRVTGACTPLVPVRTDRAIPKELIMRLMEEIKTLSVEAPVSLYDVIVQDILGTGANLVATSEAPCIARMD